MLNYISENQEWIFSGVGIFVLGLVIKWILNRKNYSQNQISGDNSTNVQVGGNLNINTKNHDK